VLLAPDRARSVAAVSEFWDAEAATFDEEPDHGLRDPAVREAWRRLLRDHLPEPPARVADLGCGTGTLSVLLAEEGYAVDGVDFSPEMVDAAREKAAGRPDLTFAVGDAGKPPLERGAYDVVLCRHVLWVLGDRSAALATWVGLLRQGGRLVLVEGFWHTGAGLRASDTEALLRQAGREPTTYALSDDTYWGGPITDERYLVVG
jgi:SAM-dependent methyltransferase